MPDNDPFLIAPELWFGVLCESLNVEARTKKMRFGSVVNRWHMADPPPGYAGKPFVVFSAILAVGFSHGVGKFEATIELRDMDDQLLWTRPEPWIFRVGPGDAPSAVFAEKVEYFFEQEGSYRFVVKVNPPGQEHLVRFEVTSEPPTAPDPPQ